jgi:hypothetical protein
MLAHRGAYAHEPEHARADKLAELRADTYMDPQVRRATFDIRKFLMSKDAPAVYGDKLTQPGRPPSGSLGRPPRRRTALIEARPRLPTPENSLIFRLPGAPNNRITRVISRSLRPRSIINRSQGCLADSPIKSIFWRGSDDPLHTLTTYR